MTINDKMNMQYKLFDWLRFPLIVGVVFIHCFGEPFDYDSIDFSQLSSMDFYNLFRVSISQVATHVCVPLFFFISGWLFFNGLEEWHNDAYLKKLKRRVKTLLIPFIIWNTLSVLMSVCSKYHSGGFPAIQEFFSSNGYWHLYWDSHVWNVDRTNWLGLCNPASSPKLVPLWYLRDLMVVMVFSPILYCLLKYTKIIGVLFLSVCYIMGLGIGVPGVSTTAFFFFGSGAYFKLNKIDVTEFAYKYRYIILILALVLWIACTAYNGHNTKMGDYIYPFYVILGGAAVLQSASYIVKNNKLTMSPVLSKSSFFIYLAHLLIFVKVCKKLVSYIVVDGNPLSMSFCYLLVPVLTVLSCLVTYYLLNRYLPRLCAVLTGER